MAVPSSFPSVATRLAYFKAQLGTNPKWALRALSVIFDHQTAAERSAHITQEDNGVGFSAFDAEILTSLAKQARYRPLSEKQMAILFKRIPRYAGQIIRVCGLDSTCPVVKQSRGAE